MAILTTFSRVLFVVGLLCVPEVAAAQGQAWEKTVTPFAPGSFPDVRPARVHYNFGWAGFSAATADIRLEKLGNRFQILASGKTVGLARGLWSYELQHKSFSAAPTLRPIQVKEVERTRSKQVTTELTFSPEGVTSAREERKGEKVSLKTRRFEFPNVLSLTSALLFLRGQPLPDGAVERVVVYPATSAYLCTMTVVGRERLTVPAGTYEAIKLDGQLSKIGKDRELLPYKKFSKATVWLSNDADRLLLRIEAQIFLGKVFTELQSVQFDKSKP